MVSPILQALLSTLFTYALTAAGAAIVFCVDTAKHHGSIMAAATGLMLAAVTELLSSCMHESEYMGSFGWVPLAVGFFIATCVLWLMDSALNRISFSNEGASDSEEVVDEEDEETIEDNHGQSRPETHKSGYDLQKITTDSHDENGIPNDSGQGEATPIREGESDGEIDVEPGLNNRENQMTRSISVEDRYEFERRELLDDGPHEPQFRASEEDFRKARLLVFALAAQHIPEALACGVAFAAAAQSGADDDQGETFGAAVSLTLAIGLQVGFPNSLLVIFVILVSFCMFPFSSQQDIPEGMAAAVILRNLGWSRRRAFFYGQLTGIVQPISGVIGAAAVMLVQTILPYALGFAGAAMLFVIVKDMIPDVLHEHDKRMYHTAIIMSSYVVMTAASIMMDQIRINK